ncbi:DUF1501 domain-containing protein [Aureispira anguillae]|uniref:DUF1501 domain-containing protein n=1 Tax=Aureispira anguillae TaxID=2864201 RepID=A0A915YIS6_9BACT|nr:DUF1501 domain-containing protein [Aureispira anguillae]BDS13726.1 DUF1501 domain-containing protein [Aureispira anguillae]
MHLNRRNFLKGLGSTIALSALPNIQNFAYQPLLSNNPNEEILVFVFLRGGCDALNFIAPMGNRHYADARIKELRVPENANFTLKNGLDGLDFNIHPKAAALKELYDSQDLAVVHATGLTNGTRSHFEAMNLIEQGLTKNQGNAVGWMTRYFETISHKGELPAVAIGGNGLPTSFLGCQQAASIDDLADFNVIGEPIMQEVLREFYNGNTFLDQTGQQTLATLQHIQKKLKKNSKGEALDYHPAHDVDYPTEWYIKSFSQSLKNLARLIKMDVGTHLAMVEYDGWDHHENQAFRFPQHLAGFSNALAAFYNDLSNYHQRMTIVVMSEFGRRLKSNRSGGTDHGHGGLALVLGGNVKGGKMYGQWPGLATHELDKNVDLAVSTDYRTILGEVLSKRLQSKKLDFIFPNFDHHQALGFL